MSRSNTRPVRSRARTRQLWVERLQRFTGSGATVVAFCQSEGISSHAFYYWKHKLQPHAPEANQPRLLPVRLLGSPSVELALPNGCVLRLGPGCDLDLVRSLVDALGGEPCRACRPPSSCGIAPTPLTCASASTGCSTSSAPG